MKSPRARPASCSASAWRRSSGWDETSVAQRATILARVGAGLKHTVLRIDEYRLRTTERQFGPPHHMPALLQRLEHVLWNRPLQRHHASAGLKARGVNRLL